MAASSAVGALGFPAATFDRVLRRPYRHRQVFGAHRATNGTVFQLMLESLNAYEFDLGAGAGTLHVAGVLYGSAVAMGLDDDLWRRYRIAAVLTARDDDVEAASVGREGNPFLHGRRAFDPSVPRDDPRNPSHDDSVQALGRRGASLFVCDIGLVQMAAFIAANPHFAGGRAQDGVLADLRAGVVPEAMRVPSGIAALNAAQENRFTYVSAS